ncbi:DUF7093 family protein [Halosegnis marinus]|uniref:DUF7093 family protein n=1 Tax=Halosegnis marinus TaxID=3034023 RepID=UPI0036137F4B
MGLTCSLLGHAFEDSDVEREREEQGSEVVTVVREVEVCARCGEQRVVSENKEVTTVVEPEEVGIDEEEAAASTALGSMADEAGGENGESGGEAGTEDDAGTPDSDGDTEPEPTPEPAADPATEPADPTDEEESAFEPPADPAEEDAEILGEETPSERRPGQWPDDEGASSRRR